MALFLEVQERRGGIEGNGDVKAPISQEGLKIPLRFTWYYADTRYFWGNELWGR